MTPIASTGLTAAPRLAGPTVRTMAARSIRVEFLADDYSDSVTSAPEIHDVSIDDSTPEVPQVLENPHVDFPGTWTLVGEGEGGTYRYSKTAQVAGQSGTLAG